MHMLILYGKSCLEGIIDFIVLYLALMLQSRLSPNLEFTKERVMSMNTRPIGNTGMQAGVVGLGCEFLDNKPYELVDEVIGLALDRGVNILDIFMPGTEVRHNIGRALRGRRDKVLIQGHIGSVDLNQQYDISRDLDVCKRYFENLLRCLETDYIDFGMLFLVDSHEDIDQMLSNGIVDYARQLKQNGTIRAIGAGSHNPETARRLVEEGLIEMLMFSINPAFDMMPDTGDIMKMMDDGYASQVSKIDPARAELYRLCQTRGIGITVMKSLCAGRLLSTDHSVFTQAMSPVQCIHYALTRPAVVSALVGCQSRKEVEAAVRYFKADDAEKDFSEAISRFRDDGKGGFKGSCVYCNHCQPCPADIDVAMVTKYLDIACLNEKKIPPSVMQHYRSLKAHASDCTRCGSCEKRCPFSVPVIRNMARATQLFEDN
jgi:predicted aldo/keto reductase-like oxidoreductase